MKRKRFVTASLVMLLLAATLPLAAQTTPAGGHIFRTPIRIVSQPDDFATQPSGYFPAQMRAAYRFNAIPNQGQGATVGIVKDPAMIQTSRRTWGCSRPSSTCRPAPATMDASR